MAKNAKESKASSPLQTRHVFLDTEVYHGLRHNTANAAFRAVLEHAQAHRLVLHVTDLTLLEIRRQISESIAARARELGAIEKDLKRWRAVAPKSAPAAIGAFDPELLSKAVYEQTASDIATACESLPHRALAIPAEQIFNTYFARKPPFHREKSRKEFPDAFVLRALENWCLQHNERMYVVTADEAMGQAADQSAPLIHVKSLHELLGIFGATLGDDLDDVAEESLQRPGFDDQFLLALEPAMKDAVFVYMGDLPDGEAYEGELVEVNALTNWTVVGLAGSRLSMIVEADIKARIEVQFEDRSAAMYDKEDDAWVGTSPGEAQIETDVEIPVFVEVDLADGRLTSLKVLEGDVAVYDPDDGWG